MTHAIFLAAKAVIAAPIVTLPKAIDNLDKLLSEPDLLVTDEEIQRARDEYALGSDDNIEIDDHACASRADDGVWVQAWVWLPNEDENE